MTLLPATIWILVMIMNGSGKAIDTIEFSSKEKCLAARELFLKHAPYDYAFCAEK
jgi:hypothetical protein